MFVTTSLVYEQLSDILESGKIKTEPIFIEFNEYLKTLGLDVALSTYMAKNTMLFESPPCINIYLKSSENFSANNIDRRDNNWSGRFKYTKDIISMWEKLLTKHDVPNSTTNNAHLHIYDFEEISLVSLTYKCKEQISAEIKAMVSINQPKYIFASSLPAYNIVYETKNDFDDAKNAGCFKKIIQICHSIISKNDTLGYWASGKIDICFRHCEEDNINLYGLSRED